MSGIGSIQAQYAVSAEHSSVPNAIMSSNAQRAIGANHSLVQVASQSGKQASGQMVQWMIAPAQNTFIKNGSAYVKFTLSITTTAITGGAISYAYGANPLRSYSSVIQSITVSSGQLIEQIAQYGNVFEPALLCHAGSYGFVQNDYAIMAGTPPAFPATSAVNTTLSTTVILPLLNGCFNPNDGADFWLGGLASGLQVQINLNTDAVALYALTGMSFTIDNAVFSYEAIKVSSEYQQALKQELISSGSLYQMPFTTARIMTSATTASMDLIYGCSLLSVKSVLVTHVPTPSVQANARKFACLGAVGPLYTDGQNSLRVYLDSVLVNNFQVPDLVSNYVELQRALGNLADRSSTSSARVGVANMTADLYATDYFVTGISCNKFNESGLCLTGTPASQIQVHMDMGGNFTVGNYPSCNTYVIILYDAILTISPLTGDSAVIQ
jgi:hypothetical protein